MADVSGSKSVYGTAGLRDEGWFGLCLVLFQPFLLESGVPSLGFRGLEGAKIDRFSIVVRVSTPIWVP